GGGDAGSPAGGGAGGGTVVARTGDIPVGGGKVFKDQDIVITQPVQGQFKAFDIKCTHRDCPVDKVENGTINCPCHGSKFSITDGSRTDGPATRPLAAKQITVQGDDITLA
ncbi:MAG TPA: Rieske (2Fe-2S) protein, partial [Thermomonospora sp.]|nr:Rieske (2Fe-2S) protein [Thermomonospora sp.]